MKDFAGDNFKFDENGRKLSKPVENTVGKGEIACYEQFILFPQCFQMASFPGASKGVIVWERVKGGYLDFSHLAELKNIYITEIYMRKQYKLSKIKNKKITIKIFFDGVPLKGYVASLSYF